MKVAVTYKDAEGVEEKAEWEQDADNIFEVLVKVVENGCHKNGSFACQVKGGAPEDAIDIRNNSLFLIGMIMSVIRSVPDAESGWLLEFVALPTS